MAQQPRPPIVTILGHVDHGKCVSGNTVIPLADGRIISARDIFEQYSKDLIAENLPDGKRFTLKGPLNIFSFDGEEIVIKKITHLWRLFAPKKLINVTLSSGDSILVTPEHPFYVFNSDGEITQRRADKLKKNEFMVCPKDLPTEFTNLKLIKDEIMQKFRSAEGWVVFLDTQKSYRFWNKVSKHRICDLISENLFSTDARGQFQKKRFKILDYMKLGSFLGFQNYELYDFIGTIKNSGNNEGWHTSKRIHMPKTVDDFSNLGYILGCFVGDGSFDKNNVLLHNNDLEISRIYREYTENIFGVKTKTVSGHTCLLIKNNAGRTLRRFINEIFDIPDHQKSANVQIPQMVQKYKPLLKEFIAGYFDTDGYVSGINYCAEFTSKSIQLIKQLGIVLLNFGIHSTIYHKNDYAYLRIANKPYLETFSKSFNFRLLKKKNRIKKVLSKSSVSRIFDSTPLTAKTLQAIRISNDVIPYWSNYKKTAGLLTRPFLKNLVALNLFSYKNDMRAVLNTSVSPVKIREIGLISSLDEFVYDFTVEDTHNFVAERLIVHNTTLLDFIRKSSVAAKEHGGITQHIGAYQVAVQNGPDAGHFQQITFIDTPGHAAFEKMRSRGAKVADIAVLIVAIDDGIMPQTIEAIKHIQQAKVPMIIAINKIDLPGIDKNVSLLKIKKQLSDQKINLEEYGGDVPVVPLSAKTGEGVEKLLEMILLVAELHEIKADPALSPTGVVIESNLDKFKGPIATILVRNGTLKKGDQIIIGSVKGKVRGMFDWNGQAVDQAGPSTPVEVLGLEAVLQVGATLGQESESHEKSKESEVRSLVDKLRQGETKSLKVVIKADKQGSLEAIQASLDKFNEDKKIIDYIFTGTGDIGEENIKLAATVGAIVIGFNVNMAQTAKKLAENEHVLVRNYNIIYELLEDIEEVVNTLLEVGQLEEIIGKANIIAEFPHGKNEKIAGCRMIEGNIAKGQKIRIIREGQNIGETKLKSLKKVKEEVNKVEKGNDCGMLFDPPIDFAIGDTVESYRVI